MLQISLIIILMALAQVKSYKTWNNLLNEIRQIVYSLYQAKKLVKKYTIK